MTGVQTCALPISDEYEHIQSFFSGIRFVKNGRLKILPALYFRQLLDRFELFREDKNWYQQQNGFYINGNDTAGFGGGIYYTGHNHHRTRVAGIDFPMQFTGKFGATSLGMEYRFEHILSNVLGEPQDSVKVPGSNAWFTNHAERDNWTGYVNHTIYLANFNIAAGCMANYNSNFGFQWYPGMDVSWKISDKFRVFWAVNKSMRFPTFTDLYYNSPTNAGNVDLTPETSVNYETGVKQYRPYIQNHISIFYRQGKNSIDWVRKSDTLKWESRNHTQINAYGIEARHTFYINKRFQKIPVEYFRTGYAYTCLAKEEKDFESKYALDFLEHKFVVDIQHSITEKLYCTWQFLFQDRSGIYYINGEENEYEPFFLTNIKIIWKLKNVKFFSTCSNLFNIRYFDYGGLYMPGRWIKGGVRINFL